MRRGTISGLAGFTLMGVLLAAILGPVLPDDWSTDAFAAAGLLAVLARATAGALLSPLGSSRRGSRRGSARSPLRA